jgi:hypothetical protein
MSNALYNQFCGQNNPFEQLAQQVRELQKQFKGNPRQEVERLLQTGQMSQKTFNELSQVAQQVVQFMNG